jgi:transposase InsO family protein
MDERLCFVADWLSSGFGFAELCRRYGVSRKTGYKWIGRYEAEGPSGLAERSRAPRSNPRSVSAEVEAALLAARDAHKHWGARKLLVDVAKHHPELVLPAASTAHEVLVRGGKVSARRRRRGLCEGTGLVEADCPNAVWAVDFKGDFLLGNGTRCYPLTITDSYSRSLLCCRSLPSTEMAGAMEVFEVAFREYGLPEVIRSDNGAPFAGTGAGRLTRLSVTWLKLGIVLDRIRPGHPEENGRHERMHRTLKAEATRPPNWDGAGQDARFEEFRREYNEERPHEALGQVPPWTLYEPSPRRYVTPVPEPEYPGHWEVRQVKRGGEIKWHGKRYFVTEALAGERVGLFEVEDGLWWVAFVTHPIAVYDARQDLMHPVRSGVGRRRIGFTAWRPLEEQDEHGQSDGPCPPP